MKIEREQPKRGKQHYVGHDPSGSNNAYTPRVPLAPILITIALVTAAPFAGWGLAALEKPPIKIEAGAPTAELEQVLHQRAAAKISPDEKILFVATPEPGHEGWAKILFVPFAIVWTLFAILWTACAISGAREMKGILGCFMVLWGLPFLAVGACMLSIPYFTYKRELHTIYAITDARTLEFTNDGVKQIVTFNNRHFGPIESRSYSKTRTDVMFRSSLDPESPGVYDGFWGIENGALATKILEEKLEQAEARAVK